MDVRTKNIRYLYMLVLCVTLSRGDKHEQGDDGNSSPHPEWFEVDCFHEPATSYSGKWNITVSGHTCQRWDSQTPHKHKYVKMRYFPMEETLYDVHNHCRDARNLGYFWCFTTDPKVRWEECNIPECANASVTAVTSTEPFHSEPQSDSSYPTTDPRQLTTLYNTSTFAEELNINETTVFSNETNVTQGTDKMVSSLSIILLQSLFSLSMYL